MKRFDIPLYMVPDVVCTCIVLHNLCITMKNSFDKTGLMKQRMNWPRKL
jgi:hypothetical protein